MINEERSYTEYDVKVPTTDFPIGFDILDDGIDVVAVTLNDVDPTTLGYTVIQVNSTTYRFAPAVPSGVVRLTRITDIDQMAHVFTEGAIFISENMDGNFKQIRHAQQEVRDAFDFLEYNTLGVVEAAKDATTAALTAASTANEAAAAVNDKVSYSDLDNAVDVAITPVKDYTALPYEPLKSYKLYERVQLENGDIVKSLVPNNIINPNVDMMGWVKPTTEMIKQYNFPIISVRDHDVKGDGSSGDQAKISEAYEYLNSIGGGTLYFPNGTYLIDTVNYVDENPTSGYVGLREQYAFPIYSNITVLGQSRENTIFKMADGIIYKDLNRANLGCALFADAHKGLHVKNFRLERFKVDMNGINNPVVNLPTGGGIDGASQQAVFPVLYFFDYYTSHNITVDNIWVHQNSGMNSIYIGHKSTQSVVRNCLFTDHSDYIDGNALIKDHSTIYISGLNNLVTNNMFVMGHDPVTTNERTKTSYISTAIEAHGVNTIVTGNIVDGYGAPFLAASTEWYNGDTILFANNKAYQAQIGFAFNSMNGQLRAQFIGNTVTLRKAKASTSDNSLRYAHAAVESMGAINSITDRSAAYSEIYVLNNVFEQEEPTDWNDADKSINACHNVKEAKLFVSKGNTFKNFKGTALHVLEHRNWLKAKILLDDNTYINCGQDKTYSLYRAAYMLKADPQASEAGFDYNLLDSVIASNETFIDCNYGVLVAKPNTLTAKTLDITGVKYLGSFIPPALIASPVDIVAGHTINIEYETTGFVSSGQTLGDFQGVSGKLKMNKWSSSNADDNLLKNFEYVKTPYYPWNMRALTGGAPTAIGQFGAFPNKNGDRVDILTPTVGEFSSFVRFNNAWYGTGKIDSANIVT